MGTSPLTGSTESRGTRGRSARKTGTVGNGVSSVNAGWGDSTTDGHVSINNAKSSHRSRQRWDHSALGARCGSELIGTQIQQGDV